MRRLAALGVLFVVSTACGSAPPPRPPESTAFVQDPTRPNVVYGIEGTVEGRTAYAFDRDTQWSVVRNKLDAAAKAGHPHASFETRVVKESVSRPSHLDVEVATEKKTTTDRELHVTLSARGAVMLKWMEGSKQIGDVISTDAAVTRIAPHIEREWNERGLYRDANDKRFDQIVLHVEPDAPYILVVTVLDAISGTKRGSVPAFVVNLPADDKMAVPTIGSKPH
jgi:hypothetical protein